MNATTPLIGLLKRRWLKEAAKERMSRTPEITAEVDKLEAEIRRLEAEASQQTVCHLSL